MFTLWCPWNVAPVVSLTLDPKPVVREWILQARYYHKVIKNVSNILNIPKLRVDRRKRFLSAESMEGTAAVWLKAVLVHEKITHTRPEHFSLCQSCSLLRWHVLFLASIPRRPGLSWWVELSLSAHLLNCSVTNLPIHSAFVYVPCLFISLPLLREMDVNESCRISKYEGSASGQNSFH